jgi:putative transposase
MGLARSTFYDEPEQVQRVDEARLVERIREVCAEWPTYGYRRVTAELQAEGRIVNHKKVMRLMKENGLTVRPRRRFVATTDSDHDGPIFPNLAENVVPTNRNQLWVADITYIAIATGFVYLAALLDAWSRRVVGYAIGKRIDARLALAALRTAIAARQPPPGCIHHSDRGSQYAADDYRAELAKHGLQGSMGRRGNPYDNAKAESFMKTLKVEEVYLMEYDTFDDVASFCRASSKTSIMPSAAIRRSDTRAPSSLRSNTPGRWPIDRHHTCPPQGVHSTLMAAIDT